MIFERIKSEGIAHNSYLIGSGSDAAVIDPRRDCQIYIDLARQYGLRIGSIFETHRNEDYVIGSVELNSFTGAEIYHGPGLDWKYGNTLGDGQEFQIGNLKLTALHTCWATIRFSLAFSSSRALRPPQTHKGQFGQHHPRIMHLQ